MANAWTKQLKSQIEKQGKRKASWYCFWKEPGGRQRKKSFGAGSDGRRLAEMHAVKLNAALKTGTYDDADKLTWDEFRKIYEEGHLSRKAIRTQAEAKNSLGHFERILKLKGKPLASITARSIERFVDARLKERGKKPGSTLSEASVNTDLRRIKATLNKARKLGYIESVPNIEFLREPERLPPFITDSDFALMFNACDSAERPTGHPDPAAWWQGLLTMDMLTGWRISELLSLEWRDVDLEEGYAVTRAAANKGRRDGIVWLHPVVRDQLAALRTSADPRERVFSWDHHRRTLDDEFARIQTAAGIHLECRIDREHECTDACHLYGFHDGRRAFATHNAARMSREALRVLMRHQSEQTTARYINYAEQIRPAAQELHVPAVLRLPAPDDEASQKAD